MFEEPYRWVEAVSNRREYLEEQLKSGSPVVALPCREGCVLLSFHAGTQKLYEIYDRIALGALGHPADVERLRNVILDMAHVEGFNRSPADVTARRLLQFGLAPMIKQAFEEITHAPFIIRLLIAELGPSVKRTFYTLNYDGVFKEAPRGAVLAPSEEAAARADSALNEIPEPGDRPFLEVAKDALKIWGIGETPKKYLKTHLEKTLKSRTIEAVLLSPEIPGPSKYRVFNADEIAAFTHEWRRD
ncbi:MAG: proteasome subunit alpha [Nitrospiria bacterium]